MEQDLYSLFEEAICDLKLENFLLESKMLLEETTTEYFNSNLLYVFDDKEKNTRRKLFSKFEPNIMINKAKIVNGIGKPVLIEPSKKFLYNFFKGITGVSIFLLLSAINPILSGSFAITYCGFNIHSSNTSSIELGKLKQVLKKDKEILKISNEIKKEIEKPLEDIDKKKLKSLRKDFARRCNEIFNKDYDYEDIFKKPKQITGGNDD